MRVDDQYSLCYILVNLVKDN